MNRQDFAAAEKNFLLAMQQYQASNVRINSLISLGPLYGMGNDIQKSELYLKEAIQIEPMNSDALAGLGNLALMQGLYADAIRYYEKAIEARPGNREAASNLAMAYERLGQFDRSESIRRSFQISR